MESQDAVVPKNTDTDLGGQFPKLIWIMWDQGFDAAPSLVRECAASWELHNPGWKVIRLDRRNLKEYIDIDDTIRLNRDTITVQAQSNIIRVNLLAKYGGVWADATCFCCRPLDEWLEPQLAGGFFSFQNAGPDRLIASWFQASRPNCHLTVAYAGLVNQYWLINRFPWQQNRTARKIIKHVGRILSRSQQRAALWVHPFVSKTFRVHPYHWYHYLFYRLVTTDERSRRLWRQMPALNSRIPNQLMAAGLLKPLTPAVKAIIDARQAPLFKLSWQADRHSQPGCIVDYLLHASAPVRPPARVPVNS